MAAASKEPSSTTAASARNCDRSISTLAMLMHHTKHELDFIPDRRKNGFMASPNAVSMLSGFGFGISLIVAIGAQNAYVLRQGLRREHVFAVVAVCAVSDVILIAVGVAGLGKVLELAPWLIDAMRVGGAAFLIAYGVLAARRAWRSAAIDADAAGTPTSLRSAITTCVALTWLNPHVYLDTVVLLGSIAATHGATRWWFGLGAIGGSILWFTALGYGARLLRPLFARPASWRVLDAVIATVMIAIAINLLRGLGAVAVA
ncbi:MAG: LysE/ArgO family amino acid transporter [Planctomycetota bacterium]